MSELCRHKWNADYVPPPTMESCEYCGARRELAPAAQDIVVMPRRDYERQPALLAALDALVAEMRKLSTGLRPAGRNTRERMQQQGAVAATEHWADRLAAELAKHRETR
jgi:hypothetical protein